MAHPAGTLLRSSKKNLASARRMMYTVIAVRRARPLTSLASAGSAFAPRPFPIEAQRSGFDEGKEEGRSGYGVFVALSQTTETKWSEFLLTISGCSAVGSAGGLGPSGRRFEPCHSDQETQDRHSAILGFFFWAGFESCPHMPVACAFDSAHTVECFYFFFASPGSGKEMHANPVTRTNGSDFDTKSEPFLTLKGQNCVIQ